MEKTNVMRILNHHKINYTIYSYILDDITNGVEVARKIHQSPSKVFKTLVTIGKSKQYYVFMIPVDQSLDLKKAAQSVNEKSIEMIKSKDLLPTTGYIHGGCSPIGMKKYFTTYIHKSANNFDTIIFSAGKIGYQVELTMADLEKIIPIHTADLIVK